MFTRDELIDKLYNGKDGSLELPYEEACTVQKILIDRGYCVLMSGGDIGDIYKIEWVYAGRDGNLDFADSRNVIFSDSEYLEMLIWGDYEDKSEEETVEKNTLKLEDTNLTKEENEKLK